MRFLHPYRGLRLATPVFLIAAALGLLATIQGPPLDDSVRRSYDVRGSPMFRYTDDAASWLDAEPPVAVGFMPVSAQQAGRNVYSGDLVVGSGEAIEGDAIVYDGDVTIRTEGSITGDLIVYRGDIGIEVGGSISGDVAAFNGDITVAGTVGGDIASWRGDVELAASSQVAGDISIVSGEITRHDDASVGGSIVRGPSLRFPLMPGRPFLFDIGPDFPGAAGVTDVQPTVWERLGRLTVRMLGAGLLAVLLGLLAGALVFVRPELIDSSYAAIRSQTALSFVVGLLANLVLLFLGMLLTLTLCLIPVALVPLLLLFGINLVGIAAISRTVGARLARYFSYSGEPAVYAGVGTLALVGLTGFLFALGSCFQVIGVVVLLGIGSLGSGGVLLPWLRRYGVQSSSIPEPTSREESLDTEAVTPSVQNTADTGQRETPDVLGEDALETGAEIPDDFTRIKGIGPVFDRRLKAANVITFRQLAAMTAEEIAEIIGWPAERVVRSNIIEQARELAGG